MGSTEYDPFPQLYLIMEADQIYEMPGILNILEMMDNVQHSIYIALELATNIQNCLMPLGQ
jgi:hypothetical protein